MATAQVDAALDLVKRLPPENVVNTLSSLVELAPSLTEELLSRVDQPLQVAMDTKANKEFLICDYNRDADSYRSPWTNEYFPPLADGTKPSQKIRDLETQCHEIYQVYRDQYYDGAGVASVYLWDAAEGSPDGAFAGCFLIHKGEGSGRHGGLDKGYWDSIHVVEAAPTEGGQKCRYKLTSTVMLHLGNKLEKGARMSLAGSMSRQQETEAPMGSGHVVNLGRLIEDTENRMRSTIDSVYFGKTREVVAHLRASDGVMAVERRQSAQTGIVADMLKKQGIGGGVALPGMGGMGGPPPGGVGLPGMMGGMPGGFDPKAALAGLRSTKKPPQ